MGKDHMCKDHIPRFFEQGSRMIEIMRKLMEEIAQGGGRTSDAASNDRVRHS